MNRTSSAAPLVIKKTAPFYSTPEIARVNALAIEAAIAADPEFYAQLVAEGAL